jgi:hypothetical protein
MKKKNPQSPAENGIPWRGSGESVEPESDDGDGDEGFGANLGGFVVANEASVLPELGEGAFDNPALGQHHEAGGDLVAFDDLDPQVGPVFAGLLGEVLSGVAAVDPPLLEPAQPAKHGGQQGESAGPFGRAGGRDLHGQHHFEGVHEEVAFAALALLGRVGADQAAVGTGLHALAIEHAGRGVAVLACGVAHPRAKPGVDDGPCAVLGPAQAGAGASLLGGLGPMGLDRGPLFVGETAQENGVFHRSKYRCRGVRGWSLPAFQQAFPNKSPLLLAIISF